MKKIIAPIACVCALALAAASCSAPKAPEAKKIEKTTYLYSIKDGDSLFADRYVVADTVPQPAVIFLFGGGFKDGSRDEPRYIPFFDFMAERGYQVISIEYRTMLAHVNPDSIASPMAFVGALQSAIDTAVVDFYDATAFVHKNAGIWGVDTDKIVACGSSAGAITVLQGEYYRSNGMPVAKLLPDGFNYAGIISCSGAIYAPTAPAWSHNPCPIMLFHGNADDVVPYRSADIPGVAGLWGSATIAEGLQGQRASYSFTTVDNATHAVSVDALNDYPFDMEQFMQSQAFGGKTLQINTNVNDPNVAPKPKDFTLEDYLRNNM